MHPSWFCSQALQIHLHIEIEKDEYVPVKMTTKDFQVHHELNPNKDIMPGAENQVNIEKGQGGKQEVNSVEGGKTWIVGIVESQQEYKNV